MPTAPQIFEQRPAWMDHGRCVGQPVSTFFPERGESVEAARRLCAECSVVGLCLEYALARQELGYWGGTSDRERARIRRDRRAQRRPRRAA